jgi:peptidoglycan/xylan/chitin deacetylase (PgdA/CDA1 family)
MATKKDIQVCFNPHFDAVSLWIGSFGGADSPCDISRGVFAARQGVPRILEMMERYGIRTTWDITGHSIESFPKESELIVKHGHELGVHGYTHENPLAMSRQQEADVLDKCIELVTDLCGVRPVGYVAPWWEMSAYTPHLLRERGIKYDHSQMHHDFEPYWMRINEEWTLIDYSKPAKSWMKPMKKGTTFPIVQIPGSWYLDDLPPMMFMKKVPNSGGWTNPRDIEDWWRDQFDWVYREMDYAVYTLTIHPDISGRPQTLLMLERIIAHISAHEGVIWATFDEIADDFIKRRPFKGKRQTKKK